MDAQGVVAEIGLCGFAEPSEDGSDECQKPGRKITVRDPFTGGLIRLCRCRNHSDWVEAVH